MLFITVDFAVGGIIVFITGTLFEILIYVVTVPLQTQKPALAGNFKRKQLEIGVVRLGKRARE